MSLPVIIIGGGPCGLLTALLLARQGVASILFEKLSGISTLPKAMGVTRRTAEIYRQLGLLDQMMEPDFTRNYQWISIWARSLVGEELGRSAMSEHTSSFTPCVAFHCPQTWTEGVLLEALREQPLADVRFDSEMIDFEQSSENVRVRVKDSYGGVQEYKGSWLIAADGAGSGIRRALDISAEGPGDMGHFLNVFFRASYGSHLGDRKAILYQALSGEGFEAFVAVNGDDLWLMHHFLQPGESPDSYPPEKMRELVRATSGLPDVPVEIIGISPWVMSPKIASAFRSGRVFLTGDAAARLSPSGGLGLNTGIQSVHNLAWKLGAVIQGGAGEGLLDTYHAERHGVALATMLNTNSNAQEMNEIIGAGIEGKWDVVRDLISQSRRGRAGLGQDLGTSYESGAFLPDGTSAVVVPDPINDYIPNARPGSRAPHLMVRTTDGEHSILDLFGDGFTVLVGRGGSAWVESGVPAFLEGKDFVSDDFEKVYGLQSDGAVVIRPDGYVGARFATLPPDPAAAFARALDVILCTGERTASSTIPESPVK